MECKEQDRAKVTKNIEGLGYINKKKTIEDVDMADQKVLVRVDFNVP